MKLKLVVMDLELSKRAKRIAAGVLVPVLVIAGGAIAYANVPHTWKDGDTLNATDLNGNFSAVDQRLLALEGVGPCPTGYTQDTSATTIVLCKNGADEIVKVGTGASAFWIDRYEASVWQKPDGTGARYGATMDDYPASFPKSGQRTPTFVDLYAVSRSGVAPSASITWFQAQQACRASGKRLPTGDEWLAAASGTNDPGSSDGAGGACLTSASAPRATGGGTTCASAWGAQDMIGNLEEWTAEWYTGTLMTTSGVTAWPSGYNADATYNVQAFNNIVPGLQATGVPSAAMRGGAYDFGTNSGVFYFNLNNAPTMWWSPSGFRCVVAR
jgi:formylglycine-generating enzyme required for sulfatase activity